MPTVDELISEYKISEECGFTPSERLKLCSWINFGLLVAEIERLRERCASDPWWWAYAEYPDEGWSGPYASREEAEAEAALQLSVDEEPPEFIYQQHANPEGCAEIERLQRQLDTTRRDSYAECLEIATNAGMLTGVDSITRRIRERLEAIDAARAQEKAGG